MNNKENENKKLDLILERLDKIEIQLNEIKNNLSNDISKNCKKMSEHIDFIDNVYDTVKNPLGFLCNKINYFNNNNDDFTLDDKSKKLSIDDK